MEKRGSNTMQPSLPPATQYSHPAKDERMNRFLPAARTRRRILLVVSALLSVLPGLFVEASATPANAAGLECPEVGQGGVPERTRDPVRARLLLSAAGAAVPSEISA